MPQGQPNMLQHFVLLIPLFLVWYLLIIKPQQKKQKEHQSMLSDLAKNDEIVTVGGLHGTIVTVKDEVLVIRVNDDTKLDINRTAVAYIKKKRGEK